LKLDLDGKRALVTGASRGIGRAVAVALAAEGAQVAIVARDGARLASLYQELGGASRGHLAMALDLMPDGAPTRLLEGLAGEFGAIDIVVHSAGGSLEVRDPFCSVADWRRVWRLNMEIAVELNARLLPVMKEKSWGRVIHVSSVSGGENLGPAPYCSVKAALNAYTRSFGRIFAPDGIVVAAVAPGAVMSEGGPWAIAERDRPEHVHRYIESNLPLKKFAKPEDISALVAFLCSGHASQFCGCVVPVDGGLGRRFT
jgi:3-oxoacyl-[acyl-carrier protein] reductase